MCKKKPKAISASTETIEVERKSQMWRNERKVGTRKKKNMKASEQHVQLSQDLILSFPLLEVKHARQTVPTNKKGIHENEI